MPLPAKRLKAEPIDAKPENNNERSVSPSPPPTKKARSSGRAAATPVSATKTKPTAGTKPKPKAKGKDKGPGSSTQTVGRRWTAAEYEALFTKGVGRIPMKHWEGAVEGRTALQCDRAWNRRLLPKILKMIRQSGDGDEPEVAGGE